MKVYIVMRFDNEEYHVGNVYFSEDDANREVLEDAMQFDHVLVREVKGLP